MEDLGPSRFEGIATAFRKKRTNTSRRPKPESHPPSEGRDISSLSSTPPSDDTRAGSSDENSGGGGGHSSRRKELSLSQCVSRIPAASVLEGEKVVKKGKKVDVGLDELYGNNNNNGSEGGMGQRRSSEGVLAPANWNNTSRVKDGSELQKTMALSSIKTDEGSVPSGDAPVTESKLRKLKVKLGGVTRTIDANSFGKSSDAGRQKSVHKDPSDDTSLPPTDRKRGLQGIPWKDFSRGGFSLGREESSMRKGINVKNPSAKQGDKSDSARKSKRATKRRAIDGYDDDDVDDEIRYLEKLKNARLAAGGRDDDEESSRKHRRLSKFAGNSPENNLEGSVSSKDGGKKRSPSEDTDYEEEEDALSDGELESRKKKRAKKDLVDTPVNESKREMTLTTRQRALQSGTGLNGNGIEFPNGLPPAPSKKQKEKLSEVDQQLKKAEAAHRRRLQNEKAARESEAEAIRRILGQDSSRKKREEKKKKREEELAQEKAADELARASNSIRLVMGPNGTTVTFPIDLGLPSIFESKPYSYPPPREKCAGPSCANPYKYRDSKTKLPLCSLGCYKAVQANLNNQTAAC